MKKTLLISLCSCFWLLLAVTGQAHNEHYQTPKDISAIKSVKVAENIYVIHGINGLPNAMNHALIANTGIVVSEEGVILIDSGGSHFYGRRLIKAVEKITSKPIIAVFNTHIHGDHWLGNHAIAERFPKAKFYANPQLIEQANAGGAEHWLGLFMQLTEGKIKGTHIHVPTIAVNHGDQLRFGNVSIRIFTEAKAHTTTDIMLSIEQPNAKPVVFLGDIAFNYRIGRMDDGSFVGSVKALDQAIAINAGTYVPGHGPVTHSVAATKEYRDYLALVYQETARLYEEGMTDFEIKEAILPAFSRWYSWLGFKDTFGRHVSLAYLEIEEASF